MTSRAATEWRYEKLTWPEINDAVDLGKVCVVPCGAVEQHGPHLPLDVDLICPTEIARGAGRQVPDKLLILPTSVPMDSPQTTRRIFPGVAEDMQMAIASEPRQRFRRWCGLARCAGIFPARHASGLYLHKKGAG